MRETSMQAESKVARVLERAQIPFRRNWALRGVVPDFLVQARDGRVFVLEVKGWETDRPNLQHLAEQQIRRFREATGADEVFVVIPSLRHPRPEKGILGESQLVKLLKAQLTTRKPPTKARTRERPVKPKKFVAAAMPFAPEYDDVYFVAMAPAAESLGAACVRIDQDYFAGDIAENIKRVIKGSSAMIADLSASNPNVLYEAGFAHGLAIPTVHICSTPLNELPFDVRNWNTIRYIKGQTHKLRNQLEKALKGVLVG